MNKYDEIVKRLGRLRPRDFVRWIYPNLELSEDPIIFKDREFEKITHRRVDLFYKIKKQNKEEFYFLLEFETGSYTDFEFRFLEYFSLIWKEVKLPVKPVVVFLNDTTTIRNNPTEIQCKIEEEVICNFRYTKIILPQESWRTILAKKLVALLPLIPLSKIPKEEEEEALERSIEEIEKIPEEIDRAEVAGAFYLIGGYKYKETLNRKIGEKLMKDLMESATYREAVEQGKEIKAREDIEKLIRFKFNEVSKQLKEKMELLKTEKELDLLFEKAAKAHILSDFEEALNQLIKKK